MTAGIDCGVMTMPCGLGIVLGPFFILEWYLAGIGGGWWLDEETVGATEGGGLTDETSCLLREVDRRTLDCASFKDSL